MSYLLGENIFLKNASLSRVSLNRNLEISPCHGRIADLRILRENSTNIEKIGRNLRNF